MTFSNFKLSNHIQRALAETGYTTPTEIQMKAIPDILIGRDLLGCAQTGTGKTAAFAIPILQRIIDGQKNNKIKALILTPTRELAIQIEDNFNTYAKYINTKTLAIYGGVSQERQVTTLKKVVDVLIATPGRLMDLIQQQLVDISKIDTLVLDEADHMLDIGFINDIKRILSIVPEKRQTLFFSATMPKSIRKFAYSILNNPIEVTVTPVSSTAQNVQQSVYFVEKNEKTALLVQLLEDESITRTLVFTRTKYGADKLVKKLGKTGIHASAIHGDKSQNARQRALADFKNSKIRVLVATDIASRGIDIDELPHVVNYELPNVPETYVHRIGRTGRAGKAGTAISFCDVDQRNEFNDIQKLIGFQMPVLNALHLSNN